jgi:hypothetical protein
MKKPFAFALVSALTIILGTGAVFAGTGNAMPSGAHYNLNLLGKNKCPGDDLVGSNRHMIMVLLRYEDLDANGKVGDVAAGPDGIPGTADDLTELFVNLDKRNKIFLVEGEFQVLDGNACNNNGATFQLPGNSGPGADGVLGTADDVLYGAVYEVYVRELGKPGGTGDLRTCAVAAGADGIEGTADDEVVCSTENVLLVRNTGKPITRNVTQELTSLLIDIDGDGNLERISLFDDDLSNYFWDYDNNGLRLVQLRFYPVQ